MRLLPTTTVPTEDLESILKGTASSRAGAKVMVCLDAQFWMAGFSSMP